jgi:hypothetical protein
MNDRVKALQERLRRKDGDARQDADDAADMLAELVEENERLRKDAERYRFLRDDKSPLGWQSFNGTTAEKIDALLDAAIDAALEPRK